MVHRYLSGIALLVGIAGLPLQASPVNPQPDAVRPATMTDAERLIDAQIEAYNRRDLEKFLSYYSDDAVLVDYPDRVTETGKDAMRARYAKSFANRDVRAAIAKRIVFGKFVIDHEQLTRAPAPGMIEAIAIYEVGNGKIVRVTFLDR